MTIVVDTGPLVSLIDRSDRTSALMQQVFSELGHDMVIPDPVVTEVDYLLRSRSGGDAARLFLADVAGGKLHRTVLDHRTFARAAQIDERYADLQLGIVDASVMAVAERERAAILTFDFRDFRATKPRRGRSWRFVIEERDLRRFD